MLRRRTAAPHLPSYLKETYNWAYLNPRNLRLLDRPLIVSAILWGNYRRLLRATLCELRSGQRVLQPACVYGDFSARLASHLGRGGLLDVTDVAPIQIENCERKLRHFDHASTRVSDASELGGGAYDAVCCFFLLHELPEAYKRKVVNALLDCVRPGGKVIFVDYHRPHWVHPVKPIMSVVFDTLEPFAKGLWEREISDYADQATRFDWSKRTYFGGLYQKIVARRPSPRAGSIKCQPERDPTLSPHLMAPNQPARLGAECRELRDIG
jgi:SAM-dependent methyltransferase